METVDIISKQIASLQKKQWVNLDALPVVSIAAMKKESVTSVTMLGRGSYNIVYKVVFSDLSTIAASISCSDEERFVAAVKESEIAAMRFVRGSGLYPTIPVPRVHSWDLTFSNPIGAPYVFMDVVEGITINKLPKIQIGQSVLRGLDTLDAEKQMTLVNTLARVQAALMKPLPDKYSRIGSPVVASVPSEVVVSTLDDAEVPYDIDIGPMVSLSGRVVGGPWRSLSEMWYSILEGELPVIMERWALLETDELDLPWTTPQEVGELFQTLAALVPHFVPPAAYLPLVLHHPDMALRNIIVDPDDYSVVRGVIDWTGARIIPLILAGGYPDDLLTSGDSPFERDAAIYPNEHWTSVPNDWTSVGDPSKWPITHRNNVLLDHRVESKAMVKRFYLRQHFGLCFSRAMYELHNDKDLSHSTLFADASYYLKFNEAVNGGHYDWVIHAPWIRETFSRLKALGPYTGKLIRGPNTYKVSAEPEFCDVGVFEPVRVMPDYNS